MNYLPSQQPDSINVAITPTGVMLMVPPVIAFNNQKEVQLFLDMIRKALTDGIEHMMGHSEDTILDRSIEPILSYEDIEDIILEIDTEWKQKVDKRNLKNRNED